ncbi:EF-hand calcium-binding domain-containing protein 11 [Irineochytrium annulatum]|nr:EF-hand calcium-binding domain-containing protein 11 [Irineochytrium annulatum]
MDHVLRADIQEVFRRSDRASKGYLTQDDLRVAIVGLLGYKPSDFELQQISRKTNLDRRELNLQAFETLMLPRLRLQEPDERIRGMFLTLDSQSNGFITLRDLRRAFAIAAPKIRTHVVDECFAEVDRDRDGKVGYREFESIMRMGLAL